MKRKIYVASSWRNHLQPDVVAVLRNDGHEVYDFRNPEPGNTGFAWSEIDPDWINWGTERFIECLNDPISVNGFGFDQRGMEWCDMCVLVLPCGRSAHLEAGWCIGKGKPTIILLQEDRFEPELMYLLTGHSNIVHTIESMREAIARIAQNGE